MKHTFWGTLPVTICLVAAGGCNVHAPLDNPKGDAGSGSEPGPGSDASPPSGPVRQLASGLDNPGGMVVDDDHVYWVNSGHGNTGSVMRVAKAGGEPQLLASNQTFPSGLVIDAHDVYWTDAGITPGDGQLMRVAKTGGTPITLATGLDFPLDLAGDADYLYWTDRHAGVKRIPKQGGTSQLLVAGELISSGIAIDEHSVYFDDITASAILSVAKTGGAVTRVASVPQNDIPFLVTDGDNVYWHTGGVDSLMQVKATGGTPSVLFPANYEMRFFLVTATDVYVTQLGEPPGMPPGPGVIHQVARMGGTDKAITPRDVGFWGIALDDKYVYWTNVSSGTVNAIARDTATAP